jgi:hypothetical protein
MRFFCRMCGHGSREGQAGQAQRWKGMMAPLKALDYIVVNG